MWFSGSVRPANGSKVGVFFSGGGFQNRLAEWDHELESTIVDPRRKGLCRVIVPLSRIFFLVEYISGVLPFSHRFLLRKCQTSSVFVPPFHLGELEGSFPDPLPRGLILGWVTPISLVYGSLLILLDVFPCSRPLLARLAMQRT